MTKNKKILLVLVGIIVIILAGFVLLNQQSPVTQEEGVSSQQEYPNNLLEGIVKAINNEEGTLILEAKTGLIEASQQDKMEKSIKITESTICETYHVDTKETDGCQFSEIMVDDNIVVVTLESTYEEINNIEEFTAIKITKMVSEIKISNE